MSMTKAMAWAAAVSARRVKPIDGLPERMAKFEAEVAEVESKPWLPSEQRRVIGELEAQLRNDVDALIVEARRETLRALDQEEGQLRRRAQVLGADATDAEVRAQVARGSRGQLLANQADRVLNPAGAMAIFEEALLSGDADTIRLTGFAVQKRLQEISAIDKGKDISALRNAAVQFDGQFGAWRKANPSTVERLAEIERVRSVEEQLFGASVEYALTLFGVTRAVPEPTLRPVPDVAPSTSGIRIGPAFDRAGLDQLAPGSGARR